VHPADGYAEDVHFKVQNMRPAKGQYQVSMTEIWESVPGEVNGDILEFLNGKELFQFKAVSKSANSIVESEKGLIFNAIEEQERSSKSGS
jgi:hypothetical protein